jgi:CRP/FNR family transcriptional regulator, cyclic AMP receptor protein
VKSLLPIYRIASISKTWFDILPEAVQGDVLARARRRRLAPGQRLFSRGDEPNGFYHVLEGCVRISGISGDGQETVLDFYGPGIWFGEVSTLDGLPRVHDADAIGSTALLQVAQADLEELLAAHPEFGRALLRLEALRLRLLLTAVESYSIQSLEHRLANRLLMLSVSHGVTTSQGLKIELHLPQETLAQLIGATRQRVNQILNDWELDGIVEQQYGRILLLDEAKLEKLAQDEAKLKTRQRKSPKERKKPQNS